MSEARQAAVQRMTALAGIPSELAAIMRPELPSLLREMANEIVAAIPEYGELVNGPEANIVRLGIEQNVAVFVDQIAMPTASTELRDEICRRFGRAEAYQGRSLDTLQDAYRIGCQVALRRARVVGRRYRLSATVLMSFADALFAYMGEIAELSREGYLQAMAELGEEPDGRRRRLLQRLLSATVDPADGSLNELAEHAGWPLPEQVVPIALHPETRPDRSRIDRDVLADLLDPEPHLLLPGPLDRGRRARLAAGLSGCRAVVGPSVPLAEAADALRWARHTLALAGAGVIDTGDPDDPIGGQILYVDDHLLKLWLVNDPALVRHFARQYLSPLAGFTPTQRSRLTNTLYAWLTSRGTATQIADSLGIHPQTFRYRSRVLERVFGDQLTDPVERFATEIALRALALSYPGQRADAAGGPGGDHLDDEAEDGGDVGGAAAGDEGGVGDAGTAEDEAEIEVLPPPGTERVGPADIQDAEIIAEVADFAAGLAADMAANWAVRVAASTTGDEAAPGSGPRPAPAAPNAETAEPTESAEPAESAEGIGADGEPAPPAPPRRRRSATRAADGRRTTARRGVRSRDREQDGNGEGEGAGAGE